MSNSLLSFISSLWRKEAAPAITLSDEGESLKISNVERAFLRNDFSESLPPVDGEYLIEKNASILNNTYDLLGLSREEFNNNYLSVVRNFANYVQLLPASEQHHHNGVGGLFRHSLEVSNAAIRRSTGIAFCGDLQGGVRAKSKVRWPLAVGLAALNHDIGKAVYDIIIRSAEGSDVWMPFDETLVSFARRHKGYRVSWNGKRVHRQHEIVGMAIIDQIIPVEIRSWLSDADSNILPTMLQAIGGFENINFPIFLKVVKEADQESTNKYQSRPQKHEESELSGDIPALPASFGDLSSVPAESAPTTSEEPLSFNTDDMAVSDVNNKDFVSSLASDKLLSLLPELLSQARLVVNRRDRERGVFWIDKTSGDAWATYPALYNSFVTLFEEFGFSAFPKTQGGFFDMLELAGILARVNNDVRSECKIGIGDKRPFTLSMAKIVSPSVISLLKRYSDADCTITFDSVDVDVEESSLIVKKDDVELAPEKTVDDDKIEGGTDVPLYSTASIKPSVVSAKKNPTAFKKTDKAKVNKTTNADLDLSFADYIGSLNNDAMRHLDAEASMVDGSDGYDKEILKTLMCGVLRARVDQDSWGVINQCLYFVWSCVPGLIGDSEDSILKTLYIAKRLASEGVGSGIDVQPSGLSHISLSGQVVQCLALSVETTNLLLDAFELSPKDLTADGLKEKLLSLPSLVQGDSFDRTDTDYVDEQSDAPKVATDIVQNPAFVAPKSLSKPKVLGKPKPLSVQPLKATVTAKPKSLTPSTLKSTPKVIKPRPEEAKVKARIKREKAKPSDEINKALVPKPLIEKTPKDLASVISSEVEGGITVLDVPGAPSTLPPKDSVFVKPNKMVDPVGDVSLDGLLNTIDIFLEANFGELKGRIWLDGSDDGQGVGVGGLPFIFNLICKEFSTIKRHFYSRIVGGDVAENSALPSHLIRRTKNIVVIKKNFLHRTYALLLAEKEVADAGE